MNGKVAALPSIVVECDGGPEMLMLYDNGVMVVPVERLPGDRVAFSHDDPCAFFDLSPEDREALYPGEWDEWEVARWYFKGVTT